MSTTKPAVDDKPGALAALYNASKQQGMGFLNPAGNQQMSRGQAQLELEMAGDEPYFDYLHGRVMKLDFSRFPLDLRLYDRDNGSGAGLRALNEASLSP
jgi:hypothetical protein